MIQKEGQGAEMIALERTRTVLFLAALLSRMIADLPISGLLEPCLKAKDGLHCCHHCLEILTVIVAGKGTPSLYLHGKGGTEEESS
jgi:hypothetical protein